MWKNFQKALEKRVKKSHKNPSLPDKFMVIKSANDYILAEYGKEGLKNVKVELSKNEDYLLFKCQKSVWKTELKLNEGKIKKAVNERLKNNSVKGCFFR